MPMPLKVLLCLTPYILAGVLIYFGLYPAFTESFSKASELDTQKSEAEQLRQKLKDKFKAEADRQSLEEQVRLLRSAVPKKPELDLLILDLERLCGQSGLDLVAIEVPESEAIRKLKASEEEVKDVLAQGEGKLTLGSKTLLKAQKKSLKESTHDEGETMLKQLVKQVYVTGNYGYIVDFMRKLEAHERVLGVSQMTVALPQESNEGERDPASERAKKLDLKQPMLSFLLTLYYLP